MEQQVLQKIHSTNYQSKMNFDEYLSEVSLGLQLIKNDGVENRHTNAKAVNLALEYNMELMIEQLQLG